MARCKPPRGLFVTGTDTGVGKTLVACALVRALRARGVNVGAMKPVATGALVEGRRLIAEDGLRLWWAAGAEDDFALVSPVACREPLAPAVAAARARKPVDLQKVFAAYKKLVVQHEFMVVEGVGGLCVPLRGKYLVLDLARRLGLPLLIVARWRLGTINHTLLTVRAARAAGLEVAGIVLNETDAAPHGVAERTVAPVLEKLAGAPVLARIPYLKGDFAQQEQKIAARLDALARRLLHR
jgi:dethiobiotin synthetase